MADPIDLTPQVKKPSILPDVLAQLMQNPPPPAPPIGTVPPPGGGGGPLPPEIAAAAAENPENRFTAPASASLPPTPPKTLGQKVLPYLKLAGAVGGGLEAAGHPMQQPFGAEMFERSLQAEKQRELEAARISQVEAPLAKAHAAYFEAFNPTKLAVQESKNVGGEDIQKIRNAGNLAVEQLRAMVQLGKVTRIEDGRDPDNGEPIKLAYNGQGQLVGKLVGSLASSAFYPKASQTTQYMPNEAGRIEALPKPTTSGLMLPPMAPQIPAASPAGVLGAPGGPPPSGATQLAPGILPALNPAPTAPPPVPARPGTQTRPQGGATARPLPQGGGANRTKGGAIQARPVVDAEGNVMHKPLSADQQKNVQQIDTVVGMIKTILPDLQSVVNDMQHGGNLQDTAKTRVAWNIYQGLGLDPANVDPTSVVAAFRRATGTELDPRLARIFPTIAMTQVVGVQPWLRGIRNMDYIRMVQQHLPDPSKQTPDAMLARITQLSQNLDIAKGALLKDAGVSPAAIGEGPAKPAAGGKKIDLTQFEGKGSQKKP